MVVHSSTKKSASLWDRFVQGDDKAFALIYKQTVDDLFRYGLIFTINRELIKDCIHDIFVKLYSNRNKLEPVENITAYLSTSLKNALINALKMQRTVSYEEETDERLDDDTPEISYIKEEKENDEQILCSDLLARLNPRQRQVVYYRYIQGMSIAEIGNILDINNQSVSNILQRAISHLKDFSKKMSIK